MKNEIQYIKNTLIEIIKKYDSLKSEFEIEKTKLHKFELEVNEKFTDVLLRLDKLKDK